MTEWHHPDSERAQLRGVETAIKLRNHLIEGSGF
jgi:hypothetical protein